MQLRAAGARHHADVMAGGDVVGLELFAVGPEFAELEPGVADDAGVGRAAGEVLVGEVVDDPAEVLLEIQRVEGDVEPVGHAAGVASVEGATAALLVGGAVVRAAVPPGAHEEADDLVPLPPEQVRGHRAVHPAAHGEHDPGRHGASLPLRPL